MMTESPIRADGRTLQPRSAWRGGLVAALAVALLAGCASVPNPDPRDPWESYNRSMTTFNDTVDDAILKPVATIYTDVVPRHARRGVSNFFGNLGDAWSFVNNMLQGKPAGSLHSFWRVVVNTTIGIGGLFDPATEMRLERHSEDFGQTLGHWGAGPGPYLVLPFFGPSTLRDTLAKPVDAWGHPLASINDVAVRNSLIGLRVVDMRAQLLGATRLLDTAALDSYSFMRDAWLQMRENEVYDGNPPFDDERYDLPED